MSINSLCLQSRVSLYSKVKGSLEDHGPSSLGTQSGLTYAPKNGGAERNDTRLSIDIHVQWPEFTRACYQTHKRSKNTHCAVLNSTRYWVGGEMTRVPLPGDPGLPRTYTAETQSRNCSFRRLCCLLASKYQHKSDKYTSRQSTHPHNN